MRLVELQPGTAVNPLQVTAVSAAPGGGTRVLMSDGRGYEVGLTRDQVCRMLEDPR